MCCTHNSPDLRREIYTWLWCKGCPEFLLSYKTGCRTEYLLSFLKGFRYPRFSCISQVNAKLWKQYATRYSLFCMMYSTPSRVLYLKYRTLAYCYTRTALLIPYSFRIHINCNACRTPGSENTPHLFHQWRHAPGHSYHINLFTLCHGIIHQQQLFPLRPLPLGIHFCL